MREFDDSWLFKPLFDYEYKSYQILAFEQFVESNLKNLKLYPYLSRIDRILSKLEQFESQKNDLKNSFPSELTGIDLDSGKILRKELSDSDKIEELNSIMHFAKSHLTKCSNQAKSLQANLEKEIEISPVGIVNNHMTGGYLFFKKPKNTRVYAYECRMIQRARDTYKDIKTIYLDVEKTGMLTDYTDFKIKYVKSKQAHFGINAYLVETNIELPHFETVLPLVKNYLMNLD